MHIQGGVVSFEQTKQIVQFEPRKVRIELNFALEDNEIAENFLPMIRDMAKRHCLEALSDKAPAAAPADTKAADAAKAAAAASMNAAEKPKATPKPPKAAAAPKAEKPAEPEKKPDLPADDWETEEPAKAEEPVKEIKDTELTQACSRKSAELQKTHQGAAPAMVKKLIASYFQDAGQHQVREIPQEERQDFLDQLEALK